MLKNKGIKSMTKLTPTHTFTKKEIKPKIDRNKEIIMIITELYSYILN